MPYQVDWYIPQRMIRIALTGTVGKDDVIQATEAAKKLMEIGQPPLYLMGDQQGIEQMNISLLELREALKVINDPRLAHVVILAKKNVVLAFFTTVVSRMVSARIKRFESREALHRFLQELDPTLDFLEVALPQ